MGWFYMASVRCKNKWVANAIESRYAGQTFVFVDDKGWQDQIVCRLGTSINVPSDDEGGVWADIAPSHITDNGLSSQEECDHANQFCNVMYGMLRNEKHFDYAIAGVEVQGFRTLKELREELAEWPDKTSPLFGHGILNWIISQLDGLVVSKEILDDFPEAAKQFQEFSPTHMWIPKKLERFQGED